MQLTETVKLYPNKYQTELIKATMTEYISTVNHLVLDAINGRAITKITTADVNVALPSALCNQCIRDAKSIIRKYNKALRNSNTKVKLPVLKKMCCYINNQNFRISDDSISFPVMINGKSKRISVKTKISKRQKSIFSSSKLGTMRIVVKGHDLVAQIVYDAKEDAVSSNDNVMGVDLGIKCPAVSYCPDESVKFYGNGRKNKYIRRHYNNLRTRFHDLAYDLYLSSSKLGTMRIVVKGHDLVAQIVYDAKEDAASSNDNVMGVDLGIKCPAVSYCPDGSIKFYGNGRKNKYIRRHYNNLRKRFQKAKKPKAVVKINNKEQRIMKDIDHKLSREIVNTAKAHDVSVIKLERLQNIRSTTRTSRKNNHNLHTWSFYRLATFIEYKAKLAGIEVEYVDPAYTSQICPICGRIQHAKDRNYICRCGYHTHRDLLGAINICNSTEYIGNRYTA